MAIWQAISRRGASHLLSWQLSTGARRNSDVPERRTASIRSRRGLRRRADDHRRRPQRATGQWDRARPSTLPRHHRRRPVAPLFREPAEPISVPDRRGQQDDQQEQRQAGPHPSGGAHRARVSARSGEGGRAARGGGRHRTEDEEHVEHGESHHQVSGVMRDVVLLVVVPAREPESPEEATDLPGEPHSKAAEDDFPEPDRQRPERRQEHAGHGDTHRHVREVDVVVHRSMPPPRYQQAAEAVSRRQEDYRRHRVREPCWVTHAEAASPRPHAVARRRQPTAAGSGRSRDQWPRSRISPRKPAR